MAVTPDKTPGAFGGAPPGAPHETTDGTVPTDVGFLGPDGQVVTASQLARAHEQDMPAFAPPQMTVAQMASFLGKSEAEIIEMRPELGVPQVASGVSSSSPAAPAPAAPPVLVDPAGTPITSTGLRRVSKPAPPVEIAVESVTVTDAAAPATVTTLADAARAAHQRQSAPADEPYRPAASNTDSPARGQPTANLPQGKQITGGFGDLGEAQYFPLTGDEAGKVGIKLLEALIARIPDDLRFSMAATYPRLTMRAVLEVQAYGNDHGFLIERKMVPAHTKTPLDVARQHAEEICFVVIEQHVEMTESGDSITPPNKARIELGLPVPRKQAVDMPGKQGRLLVDVRS